MLESFDFRWYILYAFVTNFLGKKLEKLKEIPSVSFFRIKI